MPSPEGPQRESQSGWGSGDIPPGGTYSRVFDVPDNHDHFRPDRPGHRGWVIVPPIVPDFGLDLSLDEQPVPQGQSVAYSVTVTRLIGHAAPVDLTLGPLPDGATGELAPSTVIPTGSAVLAITTELTTPVWHTRWW